MNLKYTIAILTGVCAMALTGCGDLDNYDAPDGGIHGKVIDANTGEVVLQPVNASTGLRIRLIQQNWEVAADPQLFYGVEDGTFTNSQLFNDEYSMELEQANFFPVEKQMITIKGQTDVTVKVTPFCTATVSNPSLKNRAVKANVSLKRTWDWQTDNRGCKIEKVVLFCHVSQHIDKESSNNMGSGSVNCTGVSDVDLLSGSQELVPQLVLDGSKLEKYAHIIKANGNRIFIRAAVVTKYNGAEYYNYSDVQSLLIE